MQEPLANRAKISLPKEGDRFRPIARYLGSIETDWPIAARLQAIGGDAGFLQRGLNHMLIVGLALAAVAFGNVSLPQQRLRARRYVAPSISTPAVQTTLTEPAEEPLPLPAAQPDVDRAAFIRAAVPKTIIPERPRLELTTYVVQPGDTVISIAAQFELAPETIMWANGRLEDNPDLLRAGQELVILPADGVYHQAGEGDTLEGLATTYLASVADIINHPLNQIDPEAPELQAGQWYLVPGGTKPYVPKRVMIYDGPVPEAAAVGSGAFAWPVSGQITQGYWDRHRGLDIGSWTGAPVAAADSGYVVAAQWDDTGYGRLVVIDHGNGFQTLYAHLSVYYVQVEDSVAKGQQIGEVGSTGNSTGPHLHFEIIQKGVQRNPWGFLP
ncbi:MAG: peptidoglycan DD-metalloendopeptidase family protein [Anaerolineae bacterium]